MKIKYLKLKYLVLSKSKHFKRYQSKYKYYRSKLRK